MKLSLFNPSASAFLPLAKEEYGVEYSPQNSLAAGDSRWIFPDLGKDFPDILLRKWFIRDRRPRFIISKEFDILALNNSADKFFKSQLLLIVRNGRLWARNEEERQRLYGFLRERNLKARSLVLDRSGKSMLLLQAERLLSEPNAAFGMTLYSSPRICSASITSLAGNFGLTPAEARVAHELVAGRTSRQVAGNLGCSFETVRSHKKNIYRKLSISTKYELLQMAYIFNESSEYYYPDAAC